jgi:hypothetical protein
MDLLVHNRVTGFRNLLLGKESFSWSDSSASEVTYGFTSDHRSVEPLFKLFNIEISPLAPEKYLKAMKACGVDIAPWNMVIPKKHFKQLFQRFVQDLQQGMSALDNLSYTEVYTESNKLFSRLAHSRVDLDMCKSILAKDENHILKSILGMSSSGYAPIPMYDRVSTKTGRLTIKAGPQVLTLKKEYRSVFIPSSPNTALYEIDFSSLEPRVASNLASRDVVQDVYTSFIKQAGLDVCRDVAKLAVLCSLYGASKYSLEKQLKNQKSNVTALQLMKSVKEYFCVDGLTGILRSQSRDKGVISNYFDRPIVVDDARDSILINNFLQSTAVDISLLGFEEFTRIFHNEVTPLFVIHDALIFEADPSKISRVNEYLYEGFKIKGLGNFPLKITELKKNG